MALHWDLSKVKNSEEITENEWGITEAIIWMTMSVSLQGITDENVGEFCARAALLQALHGPWLSQGIYVTDEMIRRRVGLFTNVSDEERAPWLERQVDDRATKRLINAQREESAEIIAALEAKDTADA
jgi:hypothetical protein